MMDYSVLDHSYFYLMFISLHLLLGQIGSSLVYRIRYGKSPLICYQIEKPNRHQMISQRLAIPVIAWFVQIVLLMTSASFRSWSINYPLINISPFWGLIVAGICLFGMLYCQFAMGKAFRIGQEHETAEQQKTLIVGGVFRYSRNPVYVFSTLFLWAASSWICTIPVLVSVITISFFINQLVLVEEQFLQQRFGISYLQYQQKVPRYILF